MTNLILTVLMAAGFLIIFFRVAVRPLLKLLFIERLEAADKYLEHLVSIDHVRREDFAYQFLKKKLLVKNHLGQIGISGFLHFLITGDRDEKDNENLLRFVAEASPELRSFHLDFCRNIVRWMVCNSPSYTIVGIIVVACVMVYRSMNERRVMDAAFNFADLQAKDCTC